MPSSHRSQLAEHETVPSQRRPSAEEIIRLVEEADRNERRAKIDALLSLIAAVAIAAGITAAMMVGDNLLLATLIFLAVGFISAKLLLYLFP